MQQPQASHSLAHGPEGTREAPHRGAPASPHARERHSTSASTHAAGSPAARQAHSAANNRT
eukprot:2084107-Prymnesium_polylepis.1